MGYLWQTFVPENQQGKWQPELSGLWVAFNIINGFQAIKWPVLIDCQN